MPVADVLSWCFQYLRPMSSPGLLLDIGSNGCCSYNVILPKSIIIHHYDLQTEVTNVHLRNIKLKLLVEYRGQCVLLCVAFPFADPFLFVKQEHLYIRIYMKERNN